MQLTAFRACYPLLLICHLCGWIQEPPSRPVVYILAYEGVGVIPVSHAQDLFSQRTWDRNVSVHCGEHTECITDLRDRRASVAGSSTLGGWDSHPFSGPVFPPPCCLILLVHSFALAQFLWGTLCDLHSVISEVSLCCHDTLTSCVIASCVTSTVIS